MAESKKRALSEAQARECENAVTKQCRCRCQGVHHGKGRIGKDAPRAEFEQLPQDDPHRLVPHEQRHDGEASPRARWTGRTRSGNSWYHGTLRALRGMYGGRTRRLDAKGQADAWFAAHTVTHMREGVAGCFQCRHWPAYIQDLIGALRRAEVKPENGATADRVITGAAVVPGEETGSHSVSGHATGSVKREA